MYSRAKESSHEVATFEAATLNAFVKFFTIVFEAIGKVSAYVIYRISLRLLACMRSFLFKFEFFFIFVGSAITPID